MNYVESMKKSFPSERCRGSFKLLKVYQITRNHLFIRQYICSDKICVSLMY